MSNMTYIHLSPRGELATGAADRKCAVCAEIRSSIVAIIASVVIMAGLMAFRLWFLMPASFDLHN